jgi:formiminoglutamase
VAATADPRWPSAASLLRAAARPGRLQAAVLGVHTYASSVSPRSAASTPAAVRTALERFSTWSWSDGVDLLDAVDVVDLGDVDEPDAPEGRERVAKALAGAEAARLLLVALGGDNSATSLVLSALAGEDLSTWGLVTLDAHHDLRDGHSNGSPVRELLDAGLDPRRVVQIGIADWSNSAPYARVARDVGITVIPRGALRSRSLAAVVEEALDVAGTGGSSVYVDVDLDVVDRAAVPGCPAAAPGGLSPDELRAAVRLLAADPRVRAVDVTEVDVERDAPDERTVRLAALVVLEVLAGLVANPGPRVAA